MSEIILTYGLPGSGKSKWAKSQLSRYPDKYKRVNKDDLRALIDGNKYSFENEKFILSIRDEIIIKALNKGKSVIVDDTNFPVGGKHYHRMCEIAQSVGNVLVIQKYFDISLKDALKANKGPYRVEVPESIIRNMYKKHIKGQSFNLESLYFQKVKRIKYNFKLPDCVIFDIDGTLAHHNNRNIFDWSKVGTDSLDEQMSLIFEKIKESLSTHMIIMTGRDGAARKNTEKWLYDKNLEYDMLLMKGVNDNRKDIIVKKELYEKNIKDKYNVLAVFDDRKQVIEMWRSLGILALQCDAGNF